MEWQTAKGDAATPGVDVWIWWHEPARMKRIEVFDASDAIQAWEAIYRVLRAYGVTNAVTVECEETDGTGTACPIHVATVQP